MRSIDTGAYFGMIAESIGFVGEDGAPLRAYLARPIGDGPFPAVLLFHHRPGWDAWYRQAARRFAEHGYLALCPDLYARDGTGDPDDVAAKVNADGGVHDDRVVSDAAACLRLLGAMPQASGRTAVFGTCSGARHALLAACRLPGIDAVVHCWGGRVVVPEDGATEQQPVAPVELVAGLEAPVLGLFGQDDTSPSPEQVDALEAALVAHGKQHEFHRYEGAGHGFFYDDRPANFRADQARDGWRRVLDFLATTIG